MHSESQYKTLYYFTHSYPYGNSPLWKKHELEVFKLYFSKVIVVPLTYGGNREARNVVDGIEYMKPIIDVEHSRTDRSLLDKIRILGRLFRTSVPRYFLEDISSPSVLLRPSRIKQLFRATYELALFHGNVMLEKVFDAATTDDSMLYFYWGIGQVNALLLQRARELPFTACRFHGWDLYEDRHAAKYIPYRGRLLKLLDLILPCSEDGSKYLTTRSKGLEKKMFTARLGTTSAGRSEIKNDNVLKLVSCSHMVEVKRLDLLCEALMRTTVPIRWTHIGDGKLMPMVCTYVERLPPNVNAELLGRVSPLDVPRLLVDGSFDLFVNTSRSEGVPVSIMEAFAAGIPVCATDVGGTGEIVDESVGRLVSPEIEPTELAATFEEFFSLDASAKERMRDNAFARFQERCNAEANARVLAERLMNVVND